MSIPTVYTKHHNTRMHYSHSDPSCRARTVGKFTRSRCDVELWLCHLYKVCSQSSTHTVVREYVCVHSGSHPARANVFRGFLGVQTFSACRAAHVLEVAPLCSLLHHVIRLSMGLEYTRVRGSAQPCFHTRGLKATATLSNGSKLA